MVVAALHGLLYTLKSLLRPVNLGQFFFHDVWWQMLTADGPIDDADDIDYDWRSMEKYLSCTTHYWL